MTRVGLVVALCASWVALSVSPAAAATIVVHSGESIQAAVDAARPGDTIRVDPGVYTQSVTIQKNGIKLKGAGSGPGGTQLVPGDVGGVCDFAGICVGELSDDPFTSSKDIEVSGFAIDGFPVFGIFAYGSDNLKIHDNEASHDAEYGIARFQSHGGSVVNNVVSDGGEAGIYIGDSHPANVDVRGNVSSDSLFGFFFRDSSHGHAHDNKSFGNCMGVMVLTEGEGDGPATDWHLDHNDIHDNTKACPGDDEEGTPPISGIGVGILGAQQVHIDNNVISGNAPSGPSLASGGVVVLSSQMLGGGDPNRVQVDNNRFSNNAPDDIVWDGSGSKNTFRPNKCPDGSDPAGLC